MGSNILQPQNVNEAEASIHVPCTIKFMPQDLQVYFTFSTVPASLTWHIYVHTGTSVEGEQAGRAASQHAQISAPKSTGECSLLRLRRTLTSYTHMAHLRPHRHLY